MGLLLSVRRWRHPELVMDRRWSEYRARLEALGRKPGYLNNLDGWYRRNIQPWCGHLLPEEITPAMVEREHTLRADRPVEANRAFQRCLQALFNWLRRRGDFTGPNPVDVLEFYEEHPRRHRPTPSQWSALHAALDQAERDDRDRACALCIRLVMYMGLRVNEARTLTWDRVREAHLELDTKTGYVIRELCPQARAVLDRALRNGQSEVFGIGYQKLRKFWERTRAEIGASNLTMHDLRREYSSRAADDGISEKDVAALMNQSEVTNVRHYRHLGRERRIELSARCGDLMENIQ